MSIRQRVPTFAGLELERSACIIAHVRRVGDEWIILEARIDRQIENLENLLAFDCVAAKGDASIGFANVRSMVRLEPLPVAVDQREQRDRNLE